MLLALWQVISCAPSPPSPTPTPTPIPPLTVKIVCLEIRSEPLTECDLAVEINNILDSDLQVDVIAQADKGILFKPSQDLSISSDRQQSSTYDVLGLGESRKLSFPYQIDKNIEFSGEYLIKVKVFKSDNSTLAKPLFETWKKVFITVTPEPHLLASEDEFNALFSEGYSMNNFKELTYWLKLEPGDHPTAGQLFVRMTNYKDNYAPDVTVKVNPGSILFISDEEHQTQQLTATQSPGLISEAGSRILEFPFQLDPHRKEGSYLITVVVRDEAAELIDKVPYRLKVSLTGLSIEKTTITVNIPSPTPEPTATPIPKPTSVPSSPQAQIPSTPIVGTCPIPEASCIASPPINARVKRVIEIRGSANRANFDYYKFEYKPEAASDEAWQVVPTSIRRKPVYNDVLGVFDLQSIPPGTYLLRLRVVDKTGNYWPPVQEAVLRVVIED